MKFSIFILLITSCKGYKINPIKFLKKNTYNIKNRIINVKNDVVYSKLLKDDDFITNEEILDDNDNCDIEYLDNGDINMDCNNEYLDDINNETNINLDTEIVENTDLQIEDNDYELSDEKKKITWPCVILLTSLFIAMKVLSVVINITGNITSNISEVFDNLTNNLININVTINTNINLRESLKNITGVNSTFLDEKLMIEKSNISLAKIALTVGLSITFLSFRDYFINNVEGNGLSSLGFIYGIPITLIGCALQYAELQPAMIISTPESKKIFNNKATSTMKQIVKDTSRFRYGDESHLDTSLKSLGLVVPKKKYPQLQYILINPEINNNVGMTMVFESVDTPFRIWSNETQVSKYNKFFGPDIKCSVVKVDSEKKLVGIQIKPNNY